MNPAILPGDYIIVNKMAYGSRIYKNFSLLKNGKFETFRLKGFSKVKLNDVIVFNNPYSEPSKITPNLNDYYVKRCVAIPCDTFYIEKGIYKIKGRSEVLGDYKAQQLLSVKRKGEQGMETGTCFP
jgi:signal peptidase I